MLLTHKATVWKVSLVTLLVAAVIGVVGATVYIYSGFYDIAAAEPHTGPVRSVLRTTARNSVERHARGVEIPNLADAKLIRRGFELYQELCVVCHGAPGVAKSRIGIGMNPNPPPLEDAVNYWKAEEIYWIIEHGLKMAGMPAFGIGVSPHNSWALTAFVMRLSSITPVEYARMAAAVSDPDPRVAEAFSWTRHEDPGWTTLLARGDAEEGRQLIRELGCGTCHRVPGVLGATGRNAPPLDGWSRRHYLAGIQMNTPALLVDWLVDPLAFKPGTAMPDVGASETEAWHIARYLYTLD
jgi:mono/diheme cytochrome c family protein/cytochrome c2